MFACPFRTIEARNRSWPLHINFIITTYKSTVLFTKRLIGLYNGGERKEVLMTDNVARTLKEWRLSRFWTQGEFAERIGVTTTAYNRWENGVATPSLKHIRDIAAVLEVEPSLILLPPPNEQEPGKDAPDAAA
jgi:DNA-binding XRE family transcriptional regulator